MSERRKVVIVGAGFGVLSADEQRRSHRLQFHRRTVGNTRCERGQTWSGECTIRVETGRLRRLLTVSGHGSDLQCSASLGGAVLRLHHRIQSMATWPTSRHRRQKFC